ncbi:tyrosine-protein phosphatase [Sphingomonas sp. AP4-R1]|uniref:tyrosine-protein phosphatase n=1 Tax=Sphingomonas sp. AP4-R1 TaxID=2735134 RepID=UPI0014937CB9|nr:tyrosine-protein phosphatase [Sphingomonas sp. AP4-R1]QJU59864.1 tyrosine-protein phosphatase [Sphingomonas sp. AP4-R1]
MRFTSLLALPLAAIGLSSAAFTAAALQPAPAASAEGSHERALPLQGGQNFRDLGGYRTADGRTVRWGVLYRSGSMHFLTPADYAYLQKLGIRTVCDFRSTDERQSEPSNWPAKGAPHVLADDYAMADLTGGIGFKPGAMPTAENAKATMAATYPQMLVRFNSQYRRMFGELLAGRVPLAFNCSAGKDRTGVAAALILSALGVPHDTVVEDYLLTNRYFDPQKVIRSPATTSTEWLKLPPDVLRAYMTADRAYIEAALKVVESHAGGTEGYFRDEMGLTKADLTKLRSLYTR